MSKCFQGILAVLVIPLTEDETPDEEALRVLVERVIVGGVQGVVALGSAGEFAALTDAARRETVRIVMEAVRGRVPVLVGAGEPGTRRALAMARMARELGADGVLVVPPYYYRPTDDALTRYYRTIAREGGLPVMLYNIPVFTKVSLPVEVVAQLAAEPAIIGIKDSSGDMRYFQRLVEEVSSPSFSVLTGSDGLLFIETVAGGDGCISVGANVAPEWFVSLWQAVKEGRWLEAWEIQKRVLALHRRIGYGTFPAGIKGALSVLGIGTPRVAAPNVPVESRELEAIAQALRAFGLTR